MQTFLFWKVCVSLLQRINNGIKMKDEPRFDVEYLESANNFINSLPEKAREKVFANIEKSRYIINQELFKKLDGEIWEFRTLFNGICYRLFAFWDKQQKKVVVATHGIVKKTEKTPSKEIAKAEALRKEYINFKYGEI